MKLHESYNEFLKSKHIYWVGSRFSDIVGFECYGSISLYGTTHGRHIALCDTCKERFDNNFLNEHAYDVLRSTILDIAKRDGQAVFCFYNPEWKYDIGGLESVEDRLIAVNAKEIYDFYDSKIGVHEYYKDKVEMLEAYTLPASECTLDNLGRLLGDNPDGYIVQAEKSSGGYGTLVVDKSNADKTLSALSDSRYLVSAYRKNNVPVNFHAVIYRDGVMLFPGSVQILRRENDRLIYKGSDYMAFGMIDGQLRGAAERAVLAVCEIMRADGYRGIAGIDAVIYDGRAAVVEINTRFQGSSAVLNMGLIENGRKSLQEYNLEAFYIDAPASDRELYKTLKINYAGYSYSSIEPTEHAPFIFSAVENEPHVSRIDADGYTAGMEIGHDIHMFRVCFDRNICAVNPDGGVWIHENICEPDTEIYDKVIAGDPLALKITLLTQGTRIDARAERYLKANGGIREGNNNAVDILIHDMVINAPCDVDFIAFTPYVITLNADNKLELYYYGHFVGVVTLFPLDPLSGKKTKSGRNYYDIAYLSTDRLRVHMTNKCVYKRQGKSCKFCNIDTKDTGKVIPMEDICEVLDDYIRNAPELTHFLVGGQSAEENTEKTRVVEIIRAIRERSDKNIYAMILPFSDSAIEEMINAGMTELACNIEVYDDALAKRYMPGKGAIPRRIYIDRLRRAAEQYGNDKQSVRSAMIVGLEPQASFFDGLETLLKNGIQPILSIFRPLPDTDLESLMMPPAAYIYKLFVDSERLCRKYGFSLGPSCVNCQNNTLSLPDRLCARYLR